MELPKETDSGKLIRLGLRYLFLALLVAVVAAGIQRLLDASDAVMLSVFGLLAVLAFLGATKWDHGTGVRQKAEQDARTAAEEQVAREARARDEEIARAKVRAEEESHVSNYLDEAEVYCQSFRVALHPPGDWINTHTGQLKPIFVKAKAPFLQPPSWFLEDHRRVAHLVEDSEREAWFLGEAIHDPKKWETVRHRHAQGAATGDSAWVAFAAQRVKEMQALCDQLRKAHGLQVAQDAPSDDSKAAARNWPQGGILELTMARYGAGAEQSGWRGVIEPLQSLVVNNTLRIRVANETMGGDPLPGVPKALEVRYAIGGIEGFVSVEEGKLLVLPPNS